MSQRLSNCGAFNDHIMLFSLCDVATNTTIVSKELHVHNAVINNAINWSTSISEAYYIKI